MKEIVQWRHAELTGVMQVAAHRSFRRAARELGVSPSALSHAIAALEGRMKVTLFQRTTRSVSLTEAGARFLARVTPALREIESAMASVDALQETPRGVLRLNASEGAAQHVLQPIVYPFLARYPEMSVEIVTEGRFVDIVAQGFDVGIRASDAVPRDMVAVPCSPRSRFLVVGSPAYFKRHDTPRIPADLRAHACVRRRYASGVVYPWEFARHGEALSVDVTGPLTLDSPHLMLDAALQGVALAWLSEWAVTEALAKKALIAVLTDWSPMHPAQSVYYPQHRHVPAGLRAFLDVVRASRRRKA